MRLQLLSLLPGLAASAAVEPVVPQPDLPLHNANHIFNAVHSSMRQWGSSLHHNGMSFFLASVPQGTQFYHGRHDNATVKGMEWLAFEPEHAMLFTGPRYPPGGGGHGPPGKPPGEHQRMPTDKHPDRKPSNAHHDRYRAERSPTHATDRQAPMGRPGTQDPPFTPGYIHTYRTKHPLSLLYIDGMSAGKSAKGTLDSTDILLLGWDPDADVPGGGMGETARAQQLCEMAANELGDRIDGFLRMEMGFEIILCDFEKHLDEERVTQVSERGTGNAFGDMTYYHAVAARFDGIGGNRVQLNYDDFVTAFSYEVDLFRGEQLPRLVNASKEMLSGIRDDVKRMVHLHTPPVVYRKLPVVNNWQHIADMVVEHYSSRFPDLLSSRVDSLEAFEAETAALLRPYIDYSLRNSTAEIERCATPYLPREVLDAPASAPFAAKAVLEVTMAICSNLTSAAQASSLDEAHSVIRSLMGYLQWTTWKRCTGCGVHEVCFIPIWPAGRKQDYENPQCLSNLPHLNREDTYWGVFGPRDGKRKGEHHPYPYPYPYHPHHEAYGSNEL